MSVAPDPVFIMQGKIPNRYHLITHSQFSRFLIPDHSQKELKQAGNERSATNNGRVIEPEGIRSTCAAGLGATAGPGRLGARTSWLGLGARADIVAPDYALRLLIGVKSSAIELGRGLKVESTLDLAQVGKIDPDMRIS